MNCRVKSGIKEVTRPHLINSHNKGNVSVDLMDRLLDSYRPVIRGKKWCRKNASFHKVAKCFSCRSMENPLSVGKNNLSLIWNSEDILPSAC